ncbi:amino acid adenylation domain-containing protein [Streptomyces griseus]|uniref:Amino acid adenylation domain-containing protein n=1 Tax=Streptomyces stephensoniae TaxID=3375367 RepID=A0ABU2W8L3_9ACTN|nr:amino acid adenylation domain-containing protein [Streptomyces griseus]MDT0494213.1 amino acid adenylation domain-containing protein [Streptomyces griseus]
MTEAAPESRSSVPGSRGNVSGSLGRGEPLPAAAPTVGHAVLAAARRNPGAIAVRQGRHAVTYAELTASAGRFARTLRDLGVGPEVAVGVCGRRGPHTVAAMLGVLLAGGAYVPLDPTHPRDRLLAVLDDAGAELVVVDGEGRALLADAAPDRLFVTAPAEGAVAAVGPVAPHEPHEPHEPYGPFRGRDHDQPYEPSQGRDLLFQDHYSGPDALLPGSLSPDAPPPVDDPSPYALSPDNSAYVMYTSGSTGAPKGVVVTHRNVTAFLTAAAHRLGIGADTVALATASFGFDVSVLEVFATLAAGGTVALVPEADRRSPERLGRFAAEHGVTWAAPPVSMLPLLDPADFAALRVLVATAEPVAPDQVRRWAGTADAPGVRFINAYGPTETTVEATAHDAVGDWTRPVPIGRPLPNLRVYVVDAALRRAPVGVAGELWIGGAGPARGYLGRPGATARQFVADPFSGSGGRLYRTGDLAAREADGTLRYLGRADRQLKVRGHRVEPGEVEAVLTSHPGVRQAVVDLVPAPAGPLLTAFLTPSQAPSQAPSETSSQTPSQAPSQTPSDAVLREHCRRVLPAALVPARFVRLGTLPRTASGKTDRAALHALAAPADNPGTGGGWQPDSEEAAVLARAWADVLGVPVRSGDDTFFDAGGHSLGAMRLVARLRSDLDRDVRIEDVLRSRTVDGIAAVLAAAPPTGQELTLGNPPTLSAAQRRLWFLDQLTTRSGAHNIALARRLRGPLDGEALRSALAEVARRHEVLRWRIPTADGVPTVVVDPPGEIPLPVTDLTALPPTERARALEAQLAQAAGAPFDLAADRLWRARLLRVGEDEHVLAVTAHHAVFDGWSQGLFLHDLGTAYARRTAPLPPVAASFADYVAWRADRAERRAASDLAWWRGHLDGVPPVLELPADHPRPAEQSFRGGRVETLLGTETTAAVHALARECGATPSAVLLAVLGRLAGLLAGREDVVIGTPAVDRRHPAFLDLVGFFIEVVPLRLRPAADRSFRAQLLGARDELLDALAHPEAPVERLVEELRLPRDPSRQPLVQVLFNAYNFPQPRLEMPGLGVTAEPVPVPGAPFDLTVYATESAGRYRIELVHSTDLFTAARAERLLAAYVHLLNAFLDAPDRPAGETGLGPYADLLKGTAAGPAPAPAAPQQPAVPGGGSEAAVLSVWRQVLGRDDIRATDNFFDVGGTSLLLVAVRQRLEDVLGRPLRVVDLFHHPNVRAFAAHLDGVAPTAGADRGTDRALARRRRTPSRAARRRGTD